MSKSDSSKGNTAAPPSEAARPSGERAWSDLAYAPFRWKHLQREEEWKVGIKRS